MKRSNLHCPFATLLFWVLAVSSFTVTGAHRTTTTSKEDTTYVRKLNATALQLVRINPDSSILLAQQARTVADQLSFPAGQVQALHQIGLAYWQKKEYSHAMAYLQQALQLSKERTNRPISVEKEALYKDMAALCAITANYQKAYEYQQLSFHLHNLLAHHRVSQVPTSQPAHSNEIAPSSLANAGIGVQSASRESYLWYVFMTVFGMTCIIAFVLFENNRSKQKVNQLLQLQFEEIQLQKERIEAQKASIEEKNRNLESLNTTKDKFFSIIAHDLRGPLNTLISFSNLLANDPAQMSPQEIKLIAQELSKSVKNTSRLTENLLTWARSQMDKVGFYPTSFSLTKLVEENMALFRTMAQQKGITLTATLSVDTKTQIYADEAHLRFVLRNLVSNALKFTKRGGTIDVSLVQKDALVEVAVLDSGVGMSEEVISKVFSIDAKHTTLGTAGEKGTGLGLVLCKEFVEKNGGQLHVESWVGRGSKFFFYVQVATQANPLPDGGEVAPGY